MQWISYYFGSSPFWYARYVCEDENGMLNLTLGTHIAFCIFLMKEKIECVLASAMPHYKCFTICYLLWQCNFHLNLRVQITIRMFFIIVFLITESVQVHIACANHSYTARLSSCYFSARQSMIRTYLPWNEISVFRQFNGNVGNVGLVNLSAAENDNFFVRARVSMNFDANSKNRWHSSPHRCHSMAIDVIVFIFWESVIRGIYRERNQCQYLSTEHSESMSSYLSDARRFHLNMVVYFISTGGSAWIFIQIEQHRRKRTIKWNEHNIQQRQQQQRKLSCSKYERMYGAPYCIGERGGEREASEERQFWLQ